MLVEIHGWDAREQQWHAPAAVEHSLRGCRPIARRMQQTTGSWYGKLVADIPGEPRLTFCACFHDLGDAGLGVVDLEGTEHGPLHYVLVVPGERRAHARPEFAFEFVSFLRFLEGRHSRGSEMALHDYIDQILRTPGCETIVFSVESRPLLPEMQLLVSQQAERLSMAIIAALDDRPLPLAAVAE
jgi:hypothetical protein